MSSETCHSTQGMVLPYLGMVGRFCGDGPCFWVFRSDWVLILCITTIWFTTSRSFFLQKKIGLCLLHLVPEIYGPKVDLIFLIKMYYITVFKHFVSIFSLNFLFTFSLILDCFDPLFLQNLRSDWVQFFNPATKYQKFGEIPPGVWHHIPHNHLLFSYYYLWYQGTINPSVLSIIISSKIIETNDCFTNGQHGTSPEPMLPHQLESYNHNV